MTKTHVDFRPLDVARATELEYRCLNEFKNIMRKEELPDDPPIPLTEEVQDLQNIPGFVEYEAYVLWDETGEKIIAGCQSAIYHTGDNEHLADFMIEVHPEHRRRGIGRMALKLVWRFAQKHNRRLLVTFTTEHIPAAGKFLEKLGGQKGMESRTNQLKMAEFDANLIPVWLEQSRVRQDEFTLTFLDGPYPENHISDIAALYQEVANDQPRDNLDMEDMNFTPEFLRNVEKNIFAKGNRRWTLLLTDRSNGSVAGLTEVSWNPNRAMILNQGFTGVYPTYRNKGLGRWLKAEMMEKILNERPDVKFIRTTNSNSNAPMLKINVEMGFKPYRANIIWQVETENVERYLQERP